MSVDGYLTKYFLSAVERERERVYLPQNNKKTYKIILNISTVAG